MTPDATSPFGVTSERLRELADRPDIGPTWSDDFMVAIHQLKDEADAAPLGEFISRSRIPELISEGQDLIFAIRLVCESTIRFLEDKPLELLGAGPFGLRPVLRKLADALDEVSGGTDN